MKITIIGCGKCGCKIADTFCRWNIKARVERGMGITSGIFAVDTDIMVLSRLRRIRPEHKLFLVDQSAPPEGSPTEPKPKSVAELVNQHVDRILHAVGDAEGFMETDAFMLISSAAGGTGSVIAPILAQRVKAWHPEKAVYSLIILPFEDEEKPESKTIENTVAALKSTYGSSDAVFLIDNQKYTTKDFFNREDLTKVNAAIVELFYEMLCAGEEQNSANIGAKTLDAGDIIQTLAGFTVIGQGKVRTPAFRLPFQKMSGFREKLGELQKGIQALNDAIAGLSLKCNPADARRALYLLAAPAEEMGLNIFTNIGSAVKSTVPEAIIRSGDYPRRRDYVSVTLVLSELYRIDKIADYFSKAGAALPVPAVAGPSPQPESPQPDEHADETENKV